MPQNSVSEVLLRFLFPQSLTSVKQSVCILLTLAEVTALRNRNHKHNFSHHISHPWKFHLELLVTFMFKEVLYSRVYYKGGTNLYSRYKIYTVITGFVDWLPCSIMSSMVTETLTVISISPGQHFKHIIDV